MEDYLLPRLLTPTESPELERPSNPVPTECSSPLTLKPVMFSPILVPAKDPILEDCNEDKVNYSVFVGFFPRIKV